MNRSLRTRILSLHQRMEETGVGAICEHCTYPLDYDRNIAPIKWPCPTVKLIIEDHPLNTIPSPCQPIGCDGGYHLPGCEQEDYEE